MFLAFYVIFNISEQQNRLYNMLALNNSNGLLVTKPI